MSIEKLIHKALSDADIRRILGSDTRIIKYSNLAPYNSLDELLTKPVDYCVILYEDAPNHGHWVAVSKHTDMFEHFDSYGVKPDNELHWINMKQRRMLKEATPYLSNLLKNEKYIYNHIRYQESVSTVNTCGSHVAHRLYRLKKDNMDLQGYYEFMRSLKHEYNTSYDNIVAEFINKWF